MCREVIQERVSAEGRTKKWLKIIKVDNDDFREVYEPMWCKTILVSEQDDDVADLGAWLEEFGRGQ